MKPVPFEYCRASSIDEVCAALAEDPEARVIAGGQTLMPMLAMRLVRPTRVIDVLRIGDLRGITVGPDEVGIGATTPHAEVGASAAIAAEVPLLALAVPWIGHPPIRARGTIGGSLANADPAAEAALVAVTLGADIAIATVTDTYRVPSESFFVGPMATALPQGAMVVGVCFPRRLSRPRSGAGFREVAARRGDYALAAAAVDLSLDQDGRCASLRVGIGGATGTPFLLPVDGLIGSPLAAEAVRECVTEALRGLPMMDDPHATPAYRRRAAAALAVQAVADARGAAFVAGLQESWT